MNDEDVQTPMRDVPDDTHGQVEMPFAVVLGQPVTELPTDLYIPPDALEVFLEAFEGPLDLLLYLIRRQNLNILDIPIAEITDQYIQYIGLMQEMKFELAAEYLLMAAMLAEIKSRMLLPKPPTEEDEEKIPAPNSSAGCRNTSASRKPPRILTSCHAWSATFSRHTRSSKTDRSSRCRQRWTSRNCCWHCAR